MAGNIVKEKIAAGARIIDVRTVAEFKDGAYPGAINIPLAFLPARMSELEPRDKPIVLYCASGARSGQGARLLKKARLHRRDQRGRSGRHARMSGEAPHERRFHGGAQRLRAPERLALMEVPRVVQLALEGIDARRILDVGTGSGVFAEAFAARARSVTGIDPSGELLEAARAAAPELYLYRGHGGEAPLRGLFIRPRLPWPCAPRDGRSRGCAARGETGRKDKGRDP